MSNVVPFKPRSPKERNRGKTLCKRGFHKWSVDKRTRFDVKAGRLVTVSRCVRCNIERVEST